jgi:hypothetical protein
VDDPSAMRSLYRPRQRFDQRRRRNGSHRALDEASSEAPTPYILKRKIGPALVLADRVDLSDVRIVQSRNDLSLGQEPA